MNWCHGALLATGILFVGLVGCSDRENPAIGSHETASEAAGDSGADPSSDPGHDDPDAGSEANTNIDSGPAAPAPICVSAFGSALTEDYGRIDGTLVGIARPQDSKCAMVQRTHLTLEVEINGAAYRFLVNVQSDSGAPDVYFAETQKKLSKPAWSEGWHTNATDGVYLDYASYLDVHSADFTSYPLADLTDKVARELTIGEKISIYATGFDQEGAHDIHKEGGFGTDGAVVVGPDTASPKWLIFRFDDSPTF